MTLLQRAVQRVMAEKQAAYMPGHGAFNPFSATGWAGALQGRRQGSAPVQLERSQDSLRGAQDRLYEGLRNKPLDKGQIDAFTLMTDHSNSRVHNPSPDLVGRATEMHNRLHSLLPQQRQSLLETYGQQIPPPQESHSVLRRMLGGGAREGSLRELLHQRMRSPQALPPPQAPQAPEAPKVPQAPKAPISKQG